ncbi:hypothetical protein D8S82_05630 [Mycobacterium hodleri]|uniref:Uncharacterized protein n=2 Tax=Mycolicibacterium hodleri TaxID=49897 RepID=A0A544W604_9MYCO|nr:hypothetical protein D8S82_05630 [Mycolicibacterium hodleri]
MRCRPQSTIMDDSEREKRIRFTFDELDQWLKTMTQAFTPSIGSALELDDQDWPTLPVSQLAHVGLAVAADHLDAIRCHLDASHLFALTDLTICRSALVGASQAVWILAPNERGDRLSRARMLAADALRYHGQYMEALRVADPRDPNVPLVGSHIAMRSAELKAKRLEEGPLVRHENTRMIREAASAVFPPELAAEASLEWQSGSGAAHGFAWPILNSPDTKQVGNADDGGLAEFQAVASLGRMANGYLAAFHMARAGWSLLRNRNETSE